MNVEAKSRRPLSFLIQRPSAMGGYLGVTGLAPLVAVRRTDAIGGYLDWFDMTFKLAGWTSRQTLMSEISATLAPGRYERTLDTSLVAVPSLTRRLTVLVLRARREVAACPFCADAMSFNPLILREMGSIVCSSKRIRT